MGTRRSLEEIFKNSYRIFCAENARQALEVTKDQTIDLVILDIFMDEMTGMDLLTVLHRDHPHIGVIMVTGSRSLKTAGQALRSGADDYIVKPFSVEEIRAVVDRVIKTRDAAQKKQLFNSGIGLDYDYREIVGRASALKEILDQIKYIENTKTPVLITGDTGTGKELIARAIHFRSSRSAFPFVTVHGASLPETLLESELFGHEKGSFTGAYRKKLGCFELADGGSIFLDEIGELSLLTQSKLLRVLQEGEFARVGGTDKIRVDVRVITATNRDLKEMLDRKKFREDLYYRINVVHFHLPPLRDRPEDIPLLIDHFFQEIKKEMNLPVENITPEVVTIMQKYRWPGNIRELKNVLERVLVLHGLEEAILPSHLPSEIRSSSPVISEIKDEITGDYSLQEAVNNFERELIESALERTEGNQTHAARILNTTRRILRYRVEKLKL